MASSRMQSAVYAVCGAVRAGTFGLEDGAIRQALKDHDEIVDAAVTAERARVEDAARVMAAECSALGNTESAAALTIFADLLIPTAAGEG